MFDFDATWQKQEEEAIQTTKLVAFKWKLKKRKCQLVGEEVQQIPFLTRV